MNESSRGGVPPGGGSASRVGDPPIGGYPPPSSTTSTPQRVPATHGLPRNETSGALSATATSTTSNDLQLVHMNNDIDLDSSSLSLTRLLAGDSAWEFSDPLGGSGVPTSTHNSQQQHQHLGSYRPWEAALSMASTTPTITPSTATPTSNIIASLDNITSSAPSTLTPLTTVTSVAPPPNVLAPPSTMPRPHAQGFYSSHHYSGLPSFQSQFQEIPTPPTYRAATHAPHPHYPLVPPPVQAREIPNIQQQFLDERHIQSQHQLLYGHAHHLAQPRPHYPPTSRLAAHIAANPTPRKSHQLHHEKAAPSSDVTHLTAMEAHPTLAAQLRKKTVRAGSLEGSESDHSSVDTPGQVAAISSTDPTPETLAGLADAFSKPHMTPGGGGIQHPTPSMGVDDHEKTTKKKRKRCGECTGCQRKDNCGECAPCRNDKSHQICKMRRCDKLIEKKPRKPNVSTFLKLLIFQITQFS